MRPPARPAADDLPTAIAADVFEPFAERPVLPAGLRRCSGARPSSSRWRWRATCGCSPRPGRPARARSATSRPGSSASIRYAFVQTRMFRDPRAGIMHPAIFWGFVLLTIGTANIVTGGLIQVVLSIPFDGVLWAAVAGSRTSSP